MQTLRALLVIMIALFIALIIYAGFFLVTEEKRKRLVIAYRDYFAARGRKIPELWLKRQLDKLGNKDLNLLIDFSKALQSGNKLDAALLAPQVLKVLTTKTELNKIEGLDALLRNVEIQG